MSLSLLLPLLVLLVVVLVVIAVIQRATRGRQAAAGAGADVIAYLLLALAVGVAGFSLADLMGIAFPGERFVFDPAEELANSLSALVVALPFAFFLWRRQAERRRENPEVVGWSLYLALMELTFVTAFVIAAVGWLNGILERGTATGWPEMVVFAGMVAFHHVAAARNPPGSDAADLPRVLGSAIAWVTAVIGVGGVVVATLTLLYNTMVTTSDLPEWHPFVAMALVGVPLWAYQWLRQWWRPGTARLVWTVLVAIGSYLAGVGWAIAVGAIIVDYLFDVGAPAGSQFDLVPAFLGVSLVGLASWVEHRRRLGGERSDALRAYEYAVAGAALASSVGLAVTLTMLVFDRPEIVGGGLGDVGAVAFSLAGALVVWRRFDVRWLRGDAGEESTSWARRLYTLGLGIILGLVAVGGLIGILLTVLRWALAGERGELLLPVVTFLYAGAAAWYLLASYRRDRGMVQQEAVVAPFEVTLITSHPGMIAARFPKEARLRVIHRGDDQGAIDEEMAEAIVAAVGNRPSVVWVDDDGFRVAPRRSDT